jgi:hypothetical protein
MIGIFGNEQIRVMAMRMPDKAQQVPKLAQNVTLGQTPLAALKMA